MTTITPIDHVNPDHLPDPRPYGYSTATIAPAGARIAILSGQGAQDDTGALAPDFAGQVRQAYDNLAAVLTAIGATPAQVMKLTVYVVDHDASKLATLTEGVVRIFGDSLPAQTLVPVPALALPGMLFEVDAIAAL